MADNPHSQARPGRIGVRAAAAPVDVAAAPRPATRIRGDIDPRYRWDLAPIFASWEEWERACEALSTLVERLARLQGTLAAGRPALLAALELQDEIGQLAHRVWYYPSLAYDEDQRDNAVNARRQRVQEHDGAYEGWDCAVTRGETA